MVLVGYIKTFKKWKTLQDKHSFQPCALIVSLFFLFFWLPFHNMPKLSIPLPKSTTFAFGKNKISVWKHQIFYVLETKNIFIKLHKLNWTYLTLNIIANHCGLHFLNIAVHSLLHQIWHAKEVVATSFFSSHFSNVPFMSQVCLLVFLNFVAWQEAFQHKKKVWSIQVLLFACVTQGWSV